MCPATGEGTSPSWLPAITWVHRGEVGDSICTKQRNRRDVFHFSVRLWRRVALAAATDSSRERPAPLGEKPASRGPRRPGGLGRSGRPAHASLWCGRGAERCWLARRPRSALGRAELRQAGREGRMDCAASRGRPEQGTEEDQDPGQGCGLGREETGSGSTRSLPEPHTSLPTLSLSRPPDPVDAALRRSALFPTRMGGCEQKSPKSPELAKY